MAGMIRDEIGRTWARNYGRTKDRQPWLECTRALKRTTRQQMTASELCRFERGTSAGRHPWFTPN